jgi:hypothetical protein
MINSISNTQAVGSAQSSSPTQKAASSKPAPLPPQDTVHLSAAAKAAALGDADHDGDSH